MAPPGHASLGEADCESGAGVRTGSDLLLEWGPAFPRGHGRRVPMQASDRLQGLRALARRHRLLRSVRPAPDSGRPGVATGVGEVDQAPQPRPAPAARLAGVLSGLDQLEQHLSQPGHDRSNTGGAPLPGGDLPRDSPGRSVRRGEPADRRPDPRSCSSGASPERRESRLPAEPWRTCAPTTATTPP